MTDTANTARVPRAAAVWAVLERIIGQVPFPSRESVTPAWGTLPLAGGGTQTPSGKVTAGKNEDILKRRVSRSLALRIVRQCSSRNWNLPRNLMLEKERLHGA